jgi:hypothetical protein
MPTETRKKRELKVSAAGKAVYPRVNAPDTKFDKNGVYSIKLLFEKSDKTGYAWAKATIKEIEFKQKEAMAKAKAVAATKGKKIKDKLADLPFSVDDDTGDILLSFKKKASFMKDDTLIKTTCAIFDAKGQKLAKDILIGGGSTVKVSFDMDGFYVPALGAGVSLKLFGVQVIDLVKYEGGASAEGLGFKEEEGYSGEEDNDETPSETASDDDDETAADETSDDEDDGEL